MKFNKKYVKPSAWIKVKFTDKDFVDVKHLTDNVYRCLTKDKKCLILKAEV